MWMMDTLRYAFTMYDFGLGRVGTKGREGKAAYLNGVHGRLGFETGSGFRIYTLLADC